MTIQPNPALMHTPPRKTDETRYRYFVTQQGYLYLVWRVSEMAESFDSVPDYFEKFYLPAADGSALFVTATVHFTFPEAYESVNDETAQLREFFPEADISIHISPFTS